MSVTFEPVLSNQKYRLSCACGSALSREEFDSYGEAYGKLATLLMDKNSGFPRCGDARCDPWGTFIKGMNNPINLNVSNDYGVIILDTLGWRKGESFRRRFPGEMATQELLERVLLAQAITPLALALSSRMSLPVAPKILEKFLQKIEHLGRVAGPQGTVRWY